MSLRLFRRGIVHRSQISAPLGAKPPMLAITMLEEFPSHPTELDEKTIEAVHDQILGGPHAKRTYPNRYEKIDAALFEELEGHFKNRRVRIHDMAASNGITSVELLAVAASRNVSVHASDYYDIAYVVRTGNWQVVLM